MSNTSRLLAACLLGSTLGFLSSSALAAAPLQLAHQWRHGRDVVYQQNMTKIAVFGSPNTQLLHTAIKGSMLKIVRVENAGKAKIVTVQTPQRSAPTFADLSAVATKLRSIPGASGTGPVYFDGPSLTLTTGRIWVYLPSGTNDLTARKHLEKLGLTLVDRIDAVQTIAVGVPTKSFTIDGIVQNLLSRGEDAVPELMHRVIPNYVPTDPYFVRQWPLRNTGTNVTRWQNQKTIDSVEFADARLEKAWDITKGTAGLLVGVIDSGVDCNHPELAGKCHDGYNAITNVANAAPPTKKQDEMGGHGTAVAGIIAAPEDGKGMVGACPACEIVPVRLIDTGHYLTDAMMLRAFKHAVDAGAVVINNSWGPSLGGEYHIPVSQGELQGIKYAGQGRGGKGVLVVYAAGNENADTQYLGHEQTGETNVVVVAASNHLDRRSTYSNFGVALDVSAPTNDEYITPTYISLERVGAGDLDGDYTLGFGGTSAAAPMVSGVAALVLSVNPALTAEQVRDILRSSADKIDPGSAWYDSKGHSPLYGFGRVNAYHAVLAAESKTDPACDSPAANDDCNTHLDENCDGFVDEGCGATTSVGTFCQDTSTCGSETWWECPSSGKTRETCTRSCFDQSCPVGTVCVLGKCATQCNDNHACSNTDKLVCTDDVLGLCLRKCASKSDCPTGDTCDTKTSICKLDTDGKPGSPCVADECVGSQPMCLTPGFGFPGGYCTHRCSTNADCEDAKCIKVSYGTFCYKNCSFDGDCRPGYVCQQAGQRAGTCYKKCDKDSQCLPRPGEDISCNKATGRCETPETPDAGPGDAGNDAATDATPQDGAVDGAPGQDAATGDDADTDASADASAGPSDGEESSDDDGCSCTTAGGGHRGTGSAWWLVLAGSALALSRRRFRR